jgi:hypothetical protein
LAIELGIADCTLVELHVFRLRLLLDANRLLVPGGVRFLHDLIEVLHMQQFVRTQVVLPAIDFGLDACLVR